MNLELAEELRKIEQTIVQLESEKLKEVELVMEVSICEPEEGEILGEGEFCTEETNEEWRSSEGLMDYCDSSRQPEEMLTRDEVEPEKLNHVEYSEQQRRLITEGSSDTTRSYDFEVNDLWMIAGTPQEYEQTLELVREKE